MNKQCHEKKCTLKNSKLEEERDSYKGTDWKGNCHEGRLGGQWTFGLEIKGDGETRNTVYRNSTVKFPRKDSFHSFIHWLPLVLSLLCTGYSVQTFSFWCSLYVVLVHFIYHRWNLFIFFSPVSHCIINVSSKID